MTPKLRFPEFSGDWQVKELGDILEHKSGTALESYVNEEGRYRFISIGNYSVDGHYIDNGQRINDVSPKIHERILKKDDLVMVLNDKTTSGDIIGSTILIESNEVYVYNQRSERITTKPNYVGSNFLWHKLNSRSFRKSVFSISQGGTQIYVNFPAVKKITMALPSRDEQEKIAEFLTVVDDWVAAQQQKVELLKKYKEGVMQKIFTQQIRFKDENGQNYPDWQENTLGDAIVVSMGQSPSSEAYNEDGEGLYLIQGNADIKKRKTLPRFWTRQITKTCDAGDIILTVRAPSGFVAISEHHACIGRGVCSIKPKQDFDKSLIYQFLLWFEPKWINIEQGSTFMAISGDDIKAIKMGSPSLAEQQKIADLLTAIDNKIQAEETKLNIAKTFKKGLLQRMFI